MRIKILALVFLILNSTLASEDCGIQNQEDELVPQQFNFTAFRWDGNNTTCLQKIPEERSQAVLGNVKPSIRKEDAVYILFRPITPPLVLVVADYVLQKWLEKKAKASMGSYGFTCKCGVDYVNAPKFNNCCKTVTDVWNGHTWEHHFGNCEGGCNQICGSEWDYDAPHQHWKHNICSKHTH